MFLGDRLQIQQYDETKDIPILNMLLLLLLLWTDSCFALFADVKEEEKTPEEKMDTKG